LVRRRLAISIVSFVLLSSTIILADFMSEDYREVSLSLREEEILDAIYNAAKSGLIKESDANHLFSLIARSKKVISLKHPLSDDLANILYRFEKIAEGKGLGEKDILVLQQTLEVNLRYINLNKKDPELFERFFHPSLSFPFVYIRGQGFNFHPINALNYATELLEYEKDNSSFIEVMRDLLEYIEERSYKNLSYGVMKFYFAWERESIPWISSISQGIGSAYFAIAYSITGEHEFERAARLLANSFQVPFEMGGFRIELDYGPFYVEYSNAPFDLVLNGFMLSLKGLWIYLQIIEDNATLKAFLSGITTLESLLPKYDVRISLTRSWSAYSLLYNQSVENYPVFHGTASERYHRLHVRLLYFLGRASGSSVLKAYFEKWDSYLVEAGLKSEVERSKQEYEFWISITSG